MAKIIFVTGGAASGKARFAANYFGQCDHVMYMCVYNELESDVADRIKFNCEKNGTVWEIETNADGLEKLVKDHKFLILDNLGEYLNRELSRRGLGSRELGKLSREERKEIEKKIIDEITELIWEVKEVDSTLIIISVELGFSPVPAENDQRVYRKTLGNINQRIANICTEVYLSASGVQFKIKG